MARMSRREAATASPATIPPGPAGGGLDAAALRRFRDGRWAAIREEVRERARTMEIFWPETGLDLATQRERTYQQAQALAATRGPGMMFPVEFGGEGEIGAGITGFEMLGHADLSLLVKAGVQWGLFGGAILHLGTARHHQLLPRVIALDLPGCFAMTETGHGSDVQSIRTTATYDPDTAEFVVETPDEDARKDYIGNAACHGRLAAVFAQLTTGGQARGVHCFLVPIRDEDGRPLPGVTISDCGPKMGLNGVDNGRLSFSGVRIPREALLDRHATVAADGTYFSPIENETRRFFTMLGTLVQGRVSISGAAVRASETALLIAVRYALARRQFHPPDSDREVLLLDYTQHQRRLLPAIATGYALHFAQLDLVETLHEVFSQDDGDDERRRQLESMAAGLKAVATWYATATIQTCREACGGAGYLEESRLPQLKADTDVFTTFEGDNTVLLQLVAKGLLTNYAEEFGSYDTVAMARFGARLVVESVIEKAGARPLIQSLVDSVPGLSAESDLLDPDNQLRLLQFRAEHVLSGVARRMKKLLGEGDAFAAFNACQDHVLLAARAHVDHQVLKSFAAAVERCPDPDQKLLLGRLRDLHLLSLLERERGWFMEHGQLSPARSKTVTAMVTRLCAELRPHAGLLVEAYGIPDQLVAAPIALGAESERQQAKRRLP